MAKKIDLKKDLKKVPFLFSIPTSKLEFAEDGSTADLQVLMCGEWNHPAYGKITITPETIKEFVENHKKGLRNDIPITEGHESFDEKPAIGWFKELIDKGKEGLWATIEWTEKGKTLLAEKAYKYFSPEFYTEYEDPETRKEYSNVLVGGALTNKPYFKKMQPVVVLSEVGLKNHNFQIFNDMNLQDILAKKPEELTDEEKAFVNEHVAELSDEQKTAFASVITPVETEEEKAARVEKETGDANEAKGLNRDGSAKVEEKKEEPKAEEKVEVAASELAGLREMADKGAQAFAELRKEKIAKEAKALIFSEQNSTGKILPKDEPKLVEFMSGLTDEKRKEFSDLVALIPATKIFKELGNGGSSEGSATVELQKAITLKMEGDKTLKYSDALRLVLGENKELAQKYSEELANKSNK